MRFLTILTVIVVTFMGSAPAVACEPYAFEDAAGQGRVLGPDGKWRMLQIEVHGQWVRYEYAHPRAPWGRLVVVGEIVDGRAWLFPLKIGGGLLPNEARVTWSTSLVDALAEIHLPATMVSRLMYPPTPHPEEVRRDLVNDIACTYTRPSLSARPDRVACLHSSGMPVIVRNDRGEEVFELQRIVMRPVSAGRFRRPPGYPITAKRPKYLGGFTCGGGSPAPPP